MSKDYMYLSLYNYLESQTLIHIPLHSTPELLLCKHRSEIVEINAGIATISLFGVNISTLS